MSSPVDAASIGQLFDRLAAALALYASQWTTSADDCVQEAFVELARQATAPDAPAAWLFRVVRNRALNASRASRRRVTHEQTAGERASRRDRSANDPAEAVALADLLAKLSAEQREIVVLRIWGNRTWQEIAELVGRSRSVVHRDYASALTSLRNMMGPTPCPVNKPCPTG
ncbi:MAG: sigma-70 family RNA polymerase sigma factor [Planctomycetota bacterium]